MSASISAYTGYNGSGKSLAVMIFEVAVAVRRNTPIYSTVPIAHPLYRPIKSWPEIYKMHDCLLVLDDVSAQFPSRGALSVPPQLIVKLNTLRHDNVRVVWTAPSWKRADSALREVTQEVTECRGMFPDSHERQSWTSPPRTLSGKKLKGAHGRSVRVNPLWPPNRLFRFKTYDATKLSDSQASGTAKKETRPKRKVWYWRPWQPDQFLYDTNAPVYLLDHVDQAGACLRCGGQRRKRQCTCKDGGQAIGVGEDRPLSVPDLFAVPDVVPDAWSELVGMGASS